MSDDRIVSDPSIMFGKPVVRGTRITVELILRELGSGATLDELLAAHPHLTPDDIHAAQRYAADLVAGDDVAFN